MKSSDVHLCAQSPFVYPTVLYTSTLNSLHSIFNIANRINVFYKIYSTVAYNSLIAVYYYKVNVSIVNMRYGALPFASFPSDFLPISTSLSKFQ